MGQLHVEGPMASEFLQAMLSNDLDRLSDGEAQYTLLTNERGGIVDDLIVYRMSHGHYLLVVNAGNREAAYGWLEEREARGTEVRDASDEYALVAVQGPRSLERLGLDDAPAFTHAMGEVDGVEVMVCRTGYTGEKGVELMCAEDDAVALWDAVLARGVVPAGLGARDTLRLEVCYPLHGNDITQDTDAIAAGLAWTCALDTDFTGADVLRRIKEEGPQRRLAAFVMEERAIPRPEMPIEGGGEVTSGTQSPSLDVGIGMGYVPAARAAPDTELVIDVRGKPRRARVVKKPIYRKES
jgi:aminomethyltransferase